jgi:uncharacterized DUF497 family protein
LASSSSPGTNERPQRTPGNTGFGSKKQQPRSWTLGRIYDDPDHSEYEARFLLVGRSLVGRFLLVVHAEKEDTIRIISARRATPRERERYEADA